MKCHLGIFNAILRITLSYPNVIAWKLWYNPIKNGGLMKKYIFQITTILLTIILLTGCQNNQNDLDEINQKIITLTAEINDLKTQNKEILDLVDMKYMQLSNELENTYQIVLNTQLPKKGSIDFATVQLLSTNGEIFRSSEIESLKWVSSYKKIESDNVLQNDGFTRTFDSKKDELIYTKDNVSFYYSGTSEYTELKWVKITGVTTYETPRGFKIGDSELKVLTEFPVNTDWNQNPLHVFYQSDVKSKTVTTEYGTFYNGTMRLVDHSDASYIEIDFTNNTVSEIRMYMN